MVVVVRSVPWWGLVSSAAAPVLLVGGWTLAAGLQPGSFDAVAGTISSLAAVGAADRWVMTLALAGVGACHVITGLALRPAAPAGRLVLMSGGAVVMLVAAFPETAGGGWSVPHAFWAATGFVARCPGRLAARDQSYPRNVIAAHRAGEREPPICGLRNIPRSSTGLHRTVRSGTRLWEVQGGDLHSPLQTCPHLHRRTRSVTLRHVVGPRQA
jgi:Protein of unknown function (DUF998)